MERTTEHLLAVAAVLEAGAFVEIEMSVAEAEAVAIEQLDRELLEAGLAIDGVVLDSLAVAELVAVLEQATGASLFDVDDVESLGTLRSLVATMVRIGDPDRIERYLAIKGALPVTTTSESPDRSVGR